MDGDGFDEFVLRDSERLLRLAYLLEDHVHDAEDLLQAALLKAWRAWHRVPQLPDARLAYVRKPLVNEHLSRQRRLWRGETSVDALPEVTDPAQRPSRHEHVDVVRAIALLPARQRAVVVLRYLEDLSERDTAAALRCRPGTVKSQAAKALSTLASRLGPTYLTGVH